MEDTRFTALTEVEDLTEAHYELAEDISERWSDDEPIDWEVFLAEFETQSHGDLGSSVDSPAIKALKKRVRAYRRAS
jgi:hypothetical protein